jgi:hypothetical protein
MRPVAVCSSRRPILDLQPRHRAQVAILRDDRAVAQGERDRGQLHIDDRHDAADALEKGERGRESI